MTRESITDIGVGGAALTVPLWVHQLEAWAQVVIVFGSAVLVLVRLYHLIFPNKTLKGP